jgi:predicted transcriptional regulator
MPTRYPTITIRISDNTEDMIDFLATMQGISKSQVVKDALACYLKDHVDPEYIANGLLD